MHKDKGIDHGFLAGLAGAIAAGGMSLPPQGFTRWCRICKRPIVGGEAYREPKGKGTVHTACDEDRKSSEKEKGKDAEQGQENAAGNRGSVCPEG